MWVCVFVHKVMGSAAVCRYQSGTRTGELTGNSDKITDEIQQSLLKFWVPALKWALLLSSFPPPTTFQAVEWLSNDRILWHTISTKQISSIYLTTAAFEMPGSINSCEILCGGNQGIGTKRWVCADGGLLHTTLSLKLSPGLFSVLSLAISHQLFSERLSDIQMPSVLWSSKVLLAQSLLLLHRETC